MIDFHSHVLPRMDDGSRSVEESVKILDAMRQQGITTVFATPHFSANRESVGTFLERRAQAAEALSEAYSEPLPQMRLGAEVKYYQGISRLPELDRLTLEGSGILNLEMPFETWSDYDLQEVLSLSCRSGMKIMLAHIERYYSMQKRSVWEQFLENDFLLQANADFFLGFMTRRKALSLVRDGVIHLLGSDCHGIENRPPRLGEAADVIGKKLGSEFMRHWTHRQEKLAGINVR